jgi:hypothetical protein
MALDIMGHWQKQTELSVEHLGRRIPPDHLLRKINKGLDLGFVRRIQVQRPRTLKFASTRGTHHETAIEDYGH